MVRRLGLFALAALAGLAGPGRAAAQNTWVSAWGGALMSPSTVHDGESGTVWDFGTSFMAGAGVQHLFGRSLVVGVDLGYAPARYELRPEEVAPDSNAADAVESGRAGVLTTMLSGRLGAGGGGDFFTYLGGGIGAVTYHIPALDRWDPDLALRAGGGLEYRVSRPVALFVEWNRWWVFHQSEGVDDTTGHFSNLQIGARLAPAGW